MLKENFFPVIAAILAGIVANCLVSVGIGYLFTLKKAMVISLLPKSVTTAISVDLSHTMEESMRSRLQLLFLLVSLGR